VSLAVLELCAGGGGQAVGLDAAGFSETTAAELDETCCQTLRNNKPHWTVKPGDIRNLEGREFHGIDLVAAGVPCPPFSVAGKQLGAEDDRNLFPAALRIIRDAQPTAVMLENVPGLASQKFSAYREELFLELARLGYVPFNRILNARDFGVPQLRPRLVIVALRPRYVEKFQNLHFVSCPPPTVGNQLADLMTARGWKGAAKWSRRADRIAPTIVGGSKKHGGPDLGPTRAKEQWRQLGVDALGVSDLAPDEDFPEDAYPKLTVRMVARLQGFDDSWEFAGRKTAAYRQVGNAFPPPVATAVGLRIRAALEGHREITESAVSASAHEAQIA
jgi:DNA (cytosine-5)-methyltransferase 1